LRRHKIVINNSDEVQEPVNKIDRLIHEPSRYMIMAYLYVVEVADFLFLLRQTGMTWGNLSTHLSKLESAGYLVMEKEFLGKKPHTTVRLTEQGRNAFEEYRGNMKRVLDNLPAK
jgi:DNA-binding MarR family transcriptional regulator